MQSEDCWRVVERKKRPSRRKKIDPKAWSIVTPSPEVLGYQNADVWVAAKVKEFSQVLNPKMYEAGFDDGYDYYSKARIVNESIVQFTIEGVDIQKDFENLHMLSGIILHEHDVRTQHLDLESYGTNKLDAIKDWKPISEEMKQSYDYMLQLLNDLDVALNKHGEGETFGLTHQLDGDKVDEWNRSWNHLKTNRSLDHLKNRSRNTLKAAVNNLVPLKTNIMGL